VKRLLVVLAALAALVFPVAAAAHPLGNFTINRFSRVEVAGPRVYVRYVLDLAEIPTFQAGKIDAGGYARRIARGAQLTVNGRRVRLIPVEWALAHPDGAGGLKTTRLEVILRGPALTVCGSVLSDSAAGRAFRSIFPLGLSGNRSRNSRDRRRRASPAARRATPPWWRCPSHTRRPEDLEPDGRAIAIASHPPAVAQPLHQMQPKSRVAGLRAPRGKPVRAAALRDDDPNAVRVLFGPQLNRTDPVTVGGLERIHDKLVHEQTEIDEGRLVQRRPEGLELLAGPTGALRLRRQIDCDRFAHRASRNAPTRQGSRYAAGCGAFA